MMSLWVEPDAVTRIGFSAGIGILDASGPSLSVIARTPQYPSQLLTFGTDAAAQILRSAHDRWKAIGRPSAADLRITAHPRNRAPEPGPDELSFDTAHWRLMITRENGDVR
jgi:hypothetical protein